MCALLRFRWASLDVGSILTSSGTKFIQAEVNCGNMILNLVSLFMEPIAFGLWLNTYITIRFMARVKRENEN